MKKIFIIILSLLPTSLFAQFTINNGSIFIQQFGLLTIDSLILMPQQDQSIGNTTLTHTNTAAALPGGNTINSVYNFTNPINFSGFVQIRYADAQLNGNTASSLQIAHKPSAAATWIITTGSVVDLSGHIVSQNVFNTALSSISATSSVGVATPIDLIRFDVTKTQDGKAANIVWELGRPEQCAYFEIERSVDARNFELIGKVLASSEHAYAFVDKSPKDSWNYYRLKTIEPTLEETFSEVKKLLFEKANSEINIFPNPAQSQITLFTTDQSLMHTEAYVSDIQGKIVYNFKINSEATIINVNDWAIGMYIIRLSNGQSFKIEKL